MSRMNYASYLYLGRQLNVLEKMREGLRDHLEPDVLRRRDVTAAIRSIDSAAAQLRRDLERWERAHPQVGRR